MNVLQNAKYIFTITGGFRSGCHELYVVTKDNSVLYTDKFDMFDVIEIFNVIETAQPEFIFKLDAELDFTEHTDNDGFDTPTCTMWQVKGEQLQVLYCVGMYDNTPAVDEVRKIHHQLSHSSVL